MRAWYNEIDPYAAAWLRNLITAGHIAPGDVDERDIRDVAPDDLAGYVQCHFFAGIGGWSRALRLAGWPDDRPVWTGSCPCQPFSEAGRGAGFADERHLWPAWFWLIAECRPDVIGFEQVEAALRHGWLDLVSADLEGIGYAVAAIGAPAAGVGAPHGRARVWGMAESEVRRREHGNDRKDTRQAAGEIDAPERDSWAGDVAHAHPSGLGQQRSSGLFDGERPALRHDADGCGADGIMGHAEHARLEGFARHVDDRRESGRVDSAAAGSVAEAGGAGFWSDADWLYCRDGKYRPVEPGAQPLVDGLPESLGLVGSETIAAIETEIVRYADESKSSPAQVVRDMCQGLATEAQCGWPTRGLPDLRSAPFLLAFVCQLAAQGWQLSQGLPLSRAKNARPGMRMLWDREAAASASRERGLEGQSASQRTDAVHLLSPILARHTHSAWADAYVTYAALGFPLSRGESARVGRLRAYGNAIVPQVAAEVIRAYMECRP